MSLQFDIDLTLNSFSTVITPRASAPGSFQILPRTSPYVAKHIHAHFSHYLYHSPLGRSSSYISTLTFAWYSKPSHILSIFVIFLLCIINFLIFAFVFYVHVNTVAQRSQCVVASTCEIPNMGAGNPTLWFCAGAGLTFCHHLHSPAF